MPWPGSASTTTEGEGQSPSPSNPHRRGAPDGQQSLPVLRTEIPHSRRRGSRHTGGSRPHCPPKNLSRGHDIGGGAPLAGGDLDRDLGCIGAGIVDVQRRRKRLGGDQLLVGADDNRPPLVGSDPQADPVGHREVLVPPGLLHHPDQVAGLALDLQLGGDVDVQHDDADPAAERGARPPGLRRVVGLQRQDELARLQPVSAGHDRVAVGGPLPFSYRPDDVLGVGPEAGADRRRHDL